MLKPDPGRSPSRSGVAGFYSCGRSLNDSFTTSDTERLGLLEKALEKPFIRWTFGGKPG
jgi:hypothetical protein